MDTSLYLNLRDSLTCFAVLETMLRFIICLLRFFSLLDINIRVVIFGTLLVTQLMLFGTVMKVVTKPMLFGTHRIIDNLGTLSLLLIIQTSMQLYNIDNLGMPFCALKFVLVHHYMTTQNSKCAIPSVSHIFRVWLLTLYQTKDILLIRLQNKAITSIWKIYL